MSDVFRGSVPRGPSPAIPLNASFERWDSRRQQVEDWRPWDEVWSGERWFAQECLVAHDGACSVGASKWPTMTVGIYYALGLPVEPTRRYWFEGYGLAHGLDGEAWIALSWFDAEGDWLSQDSRSPSLTGTTSGWTQLAIDGVAPPPNAVYARMFAQARSENPQARVWFDDLMLYSSKLYLPLLR
jgi:hypothetical protein